MSVLIKGMKMPKSCQSCFANEYQVCGFKDENAAINGRLGGCPLVPVPEHGRLIDLDAIPKAAWRGEKEDLVDELILAPTILPADPADKEGEG